MAPETKVTTTEQRSARLVVEAWRRGDHVAGWGAAAVDSSPSSLNAEAHAAFARVSEAADDEADRLQQLGFLSSHGAIRDLRTTSSRAAGQASRLARWSNLLAEAEQHGT